MPVRSKKYTLLSNKLCVVYQDQVVDEDDNWIFGKCTYMGDVATIYISTKDQHGEQLREDTIQSTLRHELFHFILDQLYFSDESKNETLVEWLATATLTLNKQGLNI